jgi:hypothetical protein
LTQEIDLTASVLTIGNTLYYTNLDQKIIFNDKTNLSSKIINNNSFEVKYNDNNKINLSSVSDLPQYDIFSKKERSSVF